jgi:AraC family transcriptional regulator, transcriptional activator of pobA
MKGKETETHALPVHSLGAMKHPVLINSIKGKSPYDTTTKHRHDYFEILFFETGGGSQLIDFKEWPLIDNSCYIICPRQIHLMKRGETANGKMIQFHEASITSIPLRNLLYQFSYSHNKAIIFENNKQKREKFHATIDSLHSAVINSIQFSNEIGVFYLQAILFQLLEDREQVKSDKQTDDQKLFADFQYLLEQQFEKNHTVKIYAGELKVTEKKLAAVTKLFVGLSPLQVIHNRIVLEAKRMLLFESTSHKEIAYQLGFDSPATFSQFIKTKTGYSPSDLHLHLVDIHK